MNKVNYSKRNKGITRVNIKRNKGKSKPRSSGDASDLHASDKDGLTVTFGSSILADIIIDVLM